MPLRCLDPTTNSDLQAFDLSDGDWKALLQANRQRRHLRMPCCDAEVVLKTSRQGTRFFAHKAAGDCATVPETEAHLRLKRLAVDAARACGWEAATEVTGSTPDGEAWRADVLARKGRHQVAVEIQWSNQTNEETLRRQARYRASGIRGLWLLRQPGFPVEEELPAACIGGSLEADFLALIPSHRWMSVRERVNPSNWHQHMPMTAFLQAVFSRRFRFGIQNAADSTVTVWAALSQCWHDACRAPTRVVTTVTVDTGPCKAQFTVSDLEDVPELLEIVRRLLPPNGTIGALKPRYSKTVGRTYLSNGCVACDRLYGDHFVLTERPEERKIAQARIRLAPALQQAFLSHTGWQPCWHVYSREPDIGENTFLREETEDAE